MRCGMIIGRTSLPVPQVFAYCSEASNPVGAECVIVEHMSGTEMGDVWDQLRLPQKRRLALDIINLYDQISRLSSRLWRYLSQLQLAG